MADETGTKDKAVELVLLVTVHDEYGQARLRAEVCRKNTGNDGTEYPFLSCSWHFGGYDPGAEFDGFAATAYVGEGGRTWDKVNRERGVWGLGVSYSPHHIESARQAQAIARVLGKVERGLRKTDETHGALADGDYASYVLRIARILRITEVYVRNNARNRTMAGERHRKVNGTSLQYWVRDVTESVAKGTHRDDYIKA